MIYLDHSSKLLSPCANCCNSLSLDMAWLILATVAFLIFPNPSSKVSADTAYTTSMPWSLSTTTAETAMLLT